MLKDNKNHRRYPCFIPLCNIHPWVVFCLDCKHSSISCVLFGLCNIHPCVVFCLESWTKHPSNNRLSSKPYVALGPVCFSLFILYPMYTSFLLCKLNLPLFSKEFHWVEPNSQIVSATLTISWVKRSYTWMSRNRECILTITIHESLVKRSPGVHSL